MEIVNEPDLHFNRNIRIVSTVIHTYNQHRITDLHRQDFSESPIKYPINWVANGDLLNTS